MPVDHMNGATMVVRRPAKKGPSYTLDDVFVRVFIIKRLYSVSAPMSYYGEVVEASPDGSYVRGQVVPLTVAEERIADREWREKQKLVEDGS